MAPIDIVQFHGNDREFAWKFPSENLRLGTQLVVKPAQVAFFVYRGKICDEVKSGAITLTTLMSLPFGGDTPFQAEVWFINLISKLDNKWGTLRPIQIEEPKYGLVVPVRAFGQFGFRIVNPRQFLEGITGTAKVFTAEQIVEYFKGVVLQAVNVNLGRAFVMEKISVLEASAHLNVLSGHCAGSIQAELSRFGVELVNFFFHSINIPEEDESYQRLKVIKEKAAELSVLGRDVYQFDRSIEVLKTAAANEGGGSGMMQAGVGLAVGMGFGQQMASQAGALSSQLPLALSFHVVEDGKSVGLLNWTQLQQMAQAGRLNGASLVWHPGMANWTPAGQVPELAPLFTPPPTPPMPSPSSVPPTN